MEDSVVSDDYSDTTLSSDIGWFGFRENRSVISESIQRIHPHLTQERSKD